MVQIDEPALVGDVTDEEWEALSRCLAALSEACPCVCLQTCYGDVAPYWPRLLELPVATLGVDLVAGRVRNRAAILGHPFPAEKQLVLGLVDGRNVWRSDLEDRRALVQEIAAVVPPERLLLAPSCSLLHLPETVADEERLPGALRDGLCFARERLQELDLLARALRHGVATVSDEWEVALEQRRRWLAMEDRLAPAVG
jgi:5-methyltetrahydropteroyltriglutamate--homocysteine methyltransferase